MDTARPGCLAPSRRSWLASLRRFSSVLSLALFWTACGGQEPRPNPNLLPVDPQRETFSVSVLHAVPDAAELTVVMDDKPLAQALTYRSVVSVPSVIAGTHRLELRASMSGEPLWKGHVMAQAGDRILLGAYGRANEGSNSTSPTKLQVLAERVGLARAGQLRVLHGSPGLPTVTLRSLDLTSISVPALRFGEHSRYVDLPPRAANPLRLGVTATGNGGKWLSLSGFEALSGGPYTLVLFGEIDPLADEKHFISGAVFDEQSSVLTPLTLTFDPKGPPGTVVVVHASPDVGPVDFFAQDNGARLVGGLRYQAASALLTLPTLPYGLVVRPSGDSTQLVTAKFQLLSGTHWTLVLAGMYGGKGDEALRLVMLPREAGSGQAQRRLLNALVDAPPAGRLVVSSDAGPGFSEPSIRYLPSPYRMATTEPQGLKLALAGDPRVFVTAVPQNLADAALGHNLLLLVGGTLGVGRYPVSAVGILESTATSTQPAQSFVLPVTKP